MVNPRCRIITFEGAGENANWLLNVSAGIFWPSLFDEGIKAFLAILRGRDKRKTLGRVLDRAAIVRVNRAHEGIAAYFHDNRGFFRESPRKDSRAADADPFGTTSLMRPMRNAVAASNESPRNSGPNA